jgi:hypothetical protein
LPQITHNPYCLFLTAQDKPKLADKHKRFREAMYLLKHLQGSKVQRLMKKIGQMKQALTATSTGVIFMIPHAGSF